MKRKLNFEVKRIQLQLRIVFNRSTRKTNAGPPCHLQEKNTSKQTEVKTTRGYILIRTRRRFTQNEDVAAVGNQAMGKTNT